ncbi:MAG: Dna2/Cas4 domain-containing protein [Chloroflexi bacterium]|nr:Dna2/Cas4 domain-containing protein [Chloroflexota bacterium]
MEILLVITVIIALLAAFFLRRTGRAEQAHAGIPLDARVIYSDTGAWARLEKPLFSRRYRLTGKPDYFVADETGATIPVEVKPNRTASQPRYSDTMQLMAYGILVEEKFGVRPTYGLLKYRDEVFRIEFTDALRAELFAILQDMRRARRAQNVARSHDDAVKCKYCGYREACAERLE